MLLTERSLTSVSAGGRASSLGSALFFLMRKKKSLKSPLPIYDPEVTDLYAANGKSH
jgi:hypothetical protein